MASPRADPTGDHPALQGPRADEALLAAVGDAALARLVAAHAGGAVVQGHPAGGRRVADLDLVTLAAQLSERAAFALALRGVAERRARAVGL